MKKIIFFVSLVVFSLSTLNGFSNSPDSKQKSENPVAPAKENKLSDEEINRLTKRVEEIRNMDKTMLTSKEKRALRKEIKAVKTNVRKDDIYIISGSTLFIIILICLCL